MSELPIPEEPFTMTSVAQEAHNAGVAAGRAVQLAEDSAVLEALVTAADDGTWHSSADCKSEGRTDCLLCAALAAAATGL